MGGFTFNGFGAAESFYPIRGVGTHFCRVCKKDQPWSVMEARMKIRLLYIPTLTVNTKYVVACDKCKNGYYVEKQDKEDLLYNCKELKVHSDGVELVPFGSQNSEQTVPVQAAATVVAEAIADNSLVSEENASYESAFGNKGATISEAAFNEPNEKVISSVPQSAPVSSVTARTVKQCPKCRLLFGATKETCPICGSDLEIK